jgi:hypothetical protein
MEIVIEDWSVVGLSPYSAPESGKQIVGRRQSDKKVIRTSCIVSVEGCVVTTQTGSRYRLGKPSQNYVDWCVKNNYHVPTDELPLKGYPCD